MLTKYDKIRKSQQRQKSSLFFSILLGVLVITIVGFLIVANIRINKKRNDLNAKIDALKEEIRILGQKKKDLEIRIIQTPQPENLEKEARERFDLKKPGEEVVVVLPQEEQKPSEEKEKKWWDPFSW